MPQHPSIGNLGAGGISAKAASIFQAYDSEGKNSLDHENMMSALAELGVLNGLTAKKLGRWAAWVHMEPHGAHDIMTGQDLSMGSSAGSVLVRSGLLPLSQVSVCCAVLSNRFLRIPGQTSNITHP